MPHDIFTTFLPKPTKSPSNMRSPITLQELSITSGSCALDARLRKHTNSNCAADYPIAPSAMQPIFATFFSLFATQAS
jgi:hypothetical protein